MTLVIDTISGFCPVQAEGTIAGKPFYFRARGERWTMSIGEDPVGIHDTEGPGWYCECSYGAWPDAGWMPEGEARRLIEWCAEEYQRQTKATAGGASEAQGSEA